MRAEGEWLQRLASLELPPDSADPSAAEALRYSAVQRQNPKSVVKVGRQLPRAVRGETAQYPLLDTTRLYALDKLRSAAELPEAARRHAEYYRAVFEQDCTNDSGGPLLSDGRIRTTKPGFVDGASGRMSVRQLRPVLTMKAMDAPSWEPALSFPLPENPSVELLDRARSEVLTYLDWVAHDVASAGHADEIRKEITRAAARLIEISIHWRPACDAEL